MGRPSDPAIIANALRFLVSGFKMASDKGVPAVVRRLNEPEEPRHVAARCSAEAFQAGNFQCRLPHDFLLESSGSGENGCVLVGPEAKGAATFGGPAQDGSESYRLSRVSHAYREIRGQSFRLTIDMELGEP